MKLIGWNDFEKVELRVGRIVEVSNFPEARKPAYILRIDFEMKSVSVNRVRRLPVCIPRKIWSDAW